MKTLRELMLDVNGNIRNKFKFSREEMREFLDVAQIPYTKLGEDVEKRLEIEGENLQNVLDKLKDMGLNLCDVSLAIDCDPDPYEGFDRYYTVICYTVPATEEDVRNSVGQAFNCWYEEQGQRLRELLANAGRFGYVLQEKGD